LLPFEAIVIDMAVGSKRLKPWLLAAPAASLLLVFLTATAQELIYRWVDEDGKVHYNSTLPPEYANRPHQILQNGIVIRSIEDPTQPEPVQQAAEAQENAVPDHVREREKRVRADRLLVLKYRSEAEIHEAMEVEVGNLDYDARLIERSRLSVEDSLISQISEAADRQRAGLPADPGTDDEIAQLRERLRQSAIASEKLSAREAQIRQLFMSELERYRYLTGGGIEGEPLPEPTTGEGES
jgi:hypothetical protein